MLSLPGPDCHMPRNVSERCHDSLHGPAPVEPLMKEITQPDRASYIAPRRPAACSVARSVACADTREYEAFCVSRLSAFPLYPAAICHFRLPPAVGSNEMEGWSHPGEQDHTSLAAGSDARLYVYLITLV